MLRPSGRVASRRPVDDRVNATRLSGGLVLTRPGCHLCENADAVVEAVCREAGVGWPSQDITDDPKLTRRYGERSR